MTPPRWLVRTLVVLTALLCLGTAGYAGQVWWAEQLGRKVWENCQAKSDGEWGEAGLAVCDTVAQEYVEYIIREWRETPWCGRHEKWTDGRRWRPRRAYYEELKLMTGQTLPDDPDAWESWRKSHLNVGWDWKLKRLVDRPQP